METDIHYMASVIEKIVIERNKKVDSAILGEIQKIAVENGIETKIVLNENNVAEALKKQIPQKAVLDTIYPSGVAWYRCPSCRHNNIEKSDNYCYNCGQKIEW